MNYSSNDFNEEQLEILKCLEEYTDNLDLFLSTPSPMFRDKTPYDMLLQHEYQYFDQFRKPRKPKTQPPWIK